MKTALLVFIVLLHGCGGGGESDPPENHGYGYSYNAQSQQGLKLRKVGATDADAQFLELVATNTGDCAGIKAPVPPFVIVVPKDSLAPLIGRYFSNPPLLVLDEYWYEIAFVHEHVHYLLEYSTGNRDDGHTSPLFGTCALML